jgi:tetratricopeptide (TPR) repeat protein
VALHNDRQGRLEEARARHQRGDLNFAYAAYQALLRDFPDDAKTLHYLGLLAFQTGHSQQAIELLQRSLSIDGSNAAAHGYLGQAYVANQRWTEALQSFQRAYAIAPTSAEVMNNLGNAMRQTGRSDEALALYRKAIAAEPASREAHYNLGKLLRDRRAFDEALRSFEQATTLDALNYRAQYELALCLEELGRFGEALVRYQAALLAKPDHARSMANLLALKVFDADRAFVERAIAVAERQYGSEGAAKLHQGIGKYFDRTGDHKRAFAHFAASNAIQRNWSKPPAAGIEHSKYLEAAARFDPHYFASVKHLGNPSRRPIFIVGMPRSGTTLVEQVVASHPLVFGAGELMEMPRIAAELSGRHPPNLATAAQRYLDHLSALAPDSATYVTDKLPINYRHLGTTASLFPNSRVIRCRRDSRDVLLSCYIEMFGIADEDFTSLDGIVRVILNEARLMAHWKSVLPVPIHEVDYSKFIADQEGETRRLLAFCELPWDSRCLSFYSTARFVDTPSRWQVKQPVYASSQGRWKNYSKELEGSIAVLEAEGLLAAI